MIYLYLFGTCFHFIYVFMIIGKILLAISWDCSCLPKIYLELFIFYFNYNRMC